MKTRAKAQTDAAMAGIDWFKDSEALFSIEDRGDASAAKPEKGEP